MAVEDVAVEDAVVRVVGVLAMVVIKGLMVEVKAGVVAELEAAAGEDEHWLTSPPSEKQMRCPGMSSLS